MFYYFYKITNNINNKYYYGVHQTDDLNDGYMGSGIAINNAYNKYGKSNFTKEIIRYFDNADDMFKYESVIVNEDLVADPHCYNIAIGGHGCKIHSEEVRQKMRKPKSEEHRQHMRKPKSEAHKQHMRKPKSEEHRQHMCKPKSEAHKQKISIATSEAMNRPDVKQKLREANLGENNPMYGKHWKIVDGKRVYY